jgi:hypothetical protein
MVVFLTLGAKVFGTGGYCYNEILGYIYVGYLLIGMISTWEHIGGFTQVHRTLG